MLIQLKVITVVLIIELLVWVDLFSINTAVYRLKAGIQTEEVFQYDNGL